MDILPMKHDPSTEITKINQMRVFWFNTVNSEFFARILFSRNFAYAEFRENKTLAK